MKKVIKLIGTSVAFALAGNMFGKKLSDIREKKRRKSADEMEMKRHKKVVKRGK